MTGAELRGRAPRPPSVVAARTGEPARTGGFSWMLMVLAGLLGVLVVAGLVKHRRADSDEDGPSRSVAGVSSTNPTAQPPVETQMSYTNHPARDLIAQRLREGGSVDDRVRERFRQKSRANLSFIANDHSILPDGRLKVFGRVQNSGGSVASQARVRVRILLDNGDTAAEAETPLTPAIIPPQGMAAFEIPLDYSGPVGTIKAELIWVE
jgi:hypothetical protein